MNNTVKNNNKFVFITMIVFEPTKIAKKSDTLLY